MTAYRIVTDHKELENIGVLDHEALDSYILGVGWVVASGSVGPLPPNARNLVAGPGVSIVDEGPGGNIVVSSVAAPSVRMQWMEKPQGTNDGVNTNFMLSNSPSPAGSLMLFVNGLLQEQGPNSDYVIVSGSTIQLQFDYRKGSNIWATYPY
jgi:hypothetical protein